MLDRLHEVRGEVRKGGRVKRLGLDYESTKYKHRIRSTLGARKEGSSGEGNIEGGKTRALCEKGLGVL